MIWALDLALASLAGAYVWRWRREQPVSFWRLCAFVVGVISLWVAVASPIAHMDRAHLTAHMIQHLLIMTVAAPLLLLGEPGLVFSNGRRPGRFMRGWRSPHPALCWFVGTFIVLFWHVPPVFEFGMRWHGLQHATFLIAGLIFWIPVLQPWPFVAVWPRWSIPLYLFLAMLPCDGLSAFLAFCNRIVYSRYGVQAHCAAMSLEDQQRAGALMWFWVTIAYLLPAAVVTIQLLSPQRNDVPRKELGWPRSSSSL